MIKLKLFFLLVLLSLSNAAFSQIRSFNSDPTIFMKELEDLFQKEKFEKEQFIAYCNNLNEKLMDLL